MYIMKHTNSEAKVKLNKLFYLSSVFNILSQVFNFSCLDGSKLSDSSFDIIETDFKSARKDCNIRGIFCIYI